MDYTVQSLYDVMKEVLSNDETLTLEFNHERRPQIIIDMLTKTKHFNFDTGDYLTEFGGLIVDVSFLLAYKGIKRDRFIDNLLLAHEITVMYIYDHMSEIDWKFHDLIKSGELKVRK
jgi:hypothetical protein